MTTVRLTVAQAIIRFLCAQQTERDGGQVPLFAGAWAIFGHGNVAALGEALHQHRDKLQTYRAHCEQAMAHAAVAYAKQTRRRRMMLCTSSIGPGATNMVTAAAVAHVNRLPVLFLPGDSFAGRAPDPVLQQVEHAHDPNITANDCFRPVSSYFDRIVIPEQLLSTLPRAIDVLTNPETTGPVTIALPQDVQAQAFEYPETFFHVRLHRLHRPGADPDQIARVAGVIQGSQRPVFVAGGGVHYSHAIEQFRDFISRRKIPVVETSAGKGALACNDPMNAGVVGVVGTSAANEMVYEADLIIVIGSRLSDFTTGSRTGVSSGAVPQININISSFDAGKHDAIALRSDAGRALAELDEQLGNWTGDTEWLERIEAVKSSWDDNTRSIDQTSPDSLPSDAQVTSVINRAVDPKKDVLVVAAGSMPGEAAKLWRTEYSRGYHSEYGYSCMGYEIAGGIGVKMADPGAEVFVVVGDGSYLMLNSEIATSVMLGQKLIIIVLDNRGFGCINRLQTQCGSANFNNLFDDCTTVDQGAPVIDFAAHARSLGATAEHVNDLDELAAALERAKACTGTCVISIDTNPDDTTAGGSWWEVGVPENSDRKSVEEAYREWWRPGKRQQRRAKRSG